MRKKIKRTFIIVLGIIFILLGLVGLALPFLQGFLFLAIGLILLSICSPMLREWIRIRTKPYPKLNAVVEKTERWVTRFVGEV